MAEDSKQRYQRIIQDLGQIPTMPTIAAKVMQIVNDPHSSAEDVAKFISRDVALTSKVLRLANSAFYGIPRTISSVNSAIVILGFNTIRSLVLSASVLKVFPQKPGLVRFDRKAFWKHSFMVGIASRMLAQIYRKKKLVDMETAFSAGLLHDIGKIILEQFSNEDYLPVLNAAKEKGLPLVMVEKSILGMSHADVSGMLVDKWQMPNELKGPIVFHHSPLEDKTAQDMACIVHFANHLCHLKGSGCMAEETYAPLAKEVEGLLGLGISSEQLLEELEKHIQEAEPFFSLIEAN
ncbi:MAG: HDOD domain-containing protein [Fibrobacteres bacterium]|nr:HDOD domain-containing protein [Fibrobacterota bacterium]